jgi:DNA-directed RNA polymerase specialized sigma subunit
MTAGHFKAVAHRSQGWWALDVTGDALPYPAYTQARRLDQAEAVVRDLLALHFQTTQDAVGQVEIVPVLDATLAGEVSQARHAREQAERLRADASAQTRRTAQHLKEQGMAQRDIGALLGISHQAVSQLLAS